MLNIYAKSFMTAARTDCIAVRDVKNDTQLCMPMTDTAPIVNNEMK